MLAQTFVGCLLEMRGVRYAGSDIFWVPVGNERCALCWIRDL